MTLNFLTNESKLLEQKMRYFADYYCFVNKFLGRLPSLPFETPISLLDKIAYQVRFNKGRCFNSLDIYIDELKTFNRPDFLTPACMDLITLFDQRWVGKQTDQRRLFLRDDEPLLETMDTIKQELEQTMFRSALEALYSYIVCAHPLEEHKEAIQFFTHIVIASFRLKGFSEKQVTQHIGRIIKKRKSDFPLPLTVLSKIQDPSFKEIRDAHLSEQSFKNQFDGLLNIMDAYVNQSGIFIFELSGITLEEARRNDFDATFDQVTFYAVRHKDLRPLKQAVRQRDRQSQGLKIYSKFFGKESILAVVKLGFDRLEDAAVTALKIVQKEAQFLFSYLNVHDVLIGDQGYLFTETLGDAKVAFNVRFQPKSKQPQFPHAEEIENACSNAFELLRKSGSKAAKPIMHTEQAHIKALRQQDISAYWVFIENMLWDKSEDQKKIRSKFSKLVMVTLPDIFDNFSGAIRLLIDSGELWGNYRQVGLTQELAREISSGQADWTNHANFDWNKYLPFIHHDFLKGVIELYLKLYSPADLHLWKTYFSNLAMELYEFRNSDLHSGIVNEYSRIKLTSILYYPVNRLRWKVIDYACKHPSKTYPEIIADLLNE